MNLIIDIGNTRTKLAIYKDDQLQVKEIWDDWELYDLKKFLKKHDEIQRIAISSVSFVWEDVNRYLRNNYFFLNLTETTPLPIQNNYQTPDTLGKDRLAAVVGAHAYYPDDNCLVIDAGTCITYDLITKEGVFLGGNISPGIDIRLKGMHSFTARLPLLKRAEVDKDIGYSTKSAMLIGAMTGAVMEIQGFIDHYEAQFSPFKVIFTGGSANYFEKKIKNRLFVHPNLVLKGLNKILNYNVSILE